MILIDLEIELPLFGRGELIPCQCEFCEEIFYATKRKAKAKSKDSPKGIVYCGLECLAKSNNAKPKQEVKCLYCDISFFKKNNQIKKSPNHFCSRSCAATYNNIKFPKRKGKKYSPPKFCDCGKELANRKWKFCDKCRDKGKSQKFGKYIKDITLDTFLARKNDASRFATIRKNAKTISKNWEPKCSNCDYDKHVETCHIKAISEFSPDSTIGEINHPDNLILLCPNCHWEFDNLGLEVRPTEFESAYVVSG